MVLIEMTGEDIGTKLEKGEVDLNKVWLAAYFGFRPAQECLGVRLLEKALAHMPLAVIGDVIKGLDPGHDAIRRIMLIIAKRLLLQWEASNPESDLGRHVLFGIARSAETKFNEGLWNSISTRASQWHGGWKLARCFKECYNLQDKFIFKETVLNNLFEFEYHHYNPEQATAEAIAIIGEELIPWLIEGKEISSVV